MSAGVLKTGKSNDLALLKITSPKMELAEAKSLIRKWGMKIVPLVSAGLLRTTDVSLGEDVPVAGCPYRQVSNLELV